MRYHGNMCLTVHRAAEILSLRSAVKAATHHGKKEVILQSDMKMPTRERI